MKFILPDLRFLSAPLSAVFEKISMLPSGKRSIPIPSLEVSSSVSSNSDELR